MSSRMPIPDERLDDFIARWERAFGERLARGEAEVIAGRVLALYRQLLRPLPAVPDMRDVGDVPEASTPPHASLPQSVLEAV